MSIKREFTSASCQRQPHAASYDEDSGLIAYGSHNCVAFYEPLNRYHRGPCDIVRGHEGAVQCVRWLTRPSTEDGNTYSTCGFFSASADSTVRYWEKRGDKYQTVQTLADHSSAVLLVAAIGSTTVFNYDIVVSGGSDSKLNVYLRMKDAEFTLRQTIDLNGRFPLDIALSHLPGRSSVIMAVGVTDSNIRIYAFDSISCCFVDTPTLLTGHSDWVKTLDFTDSSDGFYLASGSQDKCIRLWNFCQLANEEEAEQESQAKTKDQILSVPNGAKYAVSLNSVLVGHEDWIFSVKWHPAKTKRNANGEVEMMKPAQLLSCSADKSMMIWAPEPMTGIWTSGVQVGDLGGTSQGIFGALWADRGNAIVGHGCYGEFQVWRKVSSLGTNDDNDDGSEEDDLALTEWQDLPSATGHFKAVSDLTWDPSFSYLITTSHDQTTRVFAPWTRPTEEGTMISTWHEIARPQVHGYDLQAIACISPFEFVSGADVEKVIRQFKMPRAVYESLEMISGVAPLIVDSNSLAKTAALPALGLSNKAVGDGTAEGSEVPLEEMSFFTEPPRPTTLHHFTLWPETDKLYGHGDSVYTLAASHDGTMIASASIGRIGGRIEETAIRIWKRASEDESFTESQTPLQSHSLTVTSIKFSWSDNYLLAVGRDRMWSIFELDGNEFRLKAACPKAHSRIIWDASWSFDDKMFCTGSRDKTISFWFLDSLSEKPRQTIRFESAVTSIDFLPVSGPEVQFPYIIAVGLESGNLHILKGDSTGQKWQEITAMTGDNAHAASVTGTAWKVTDPETSSQAMVGRTALGDVEERQYQLATCSDDHTVRIWSVVLI